MKITKLLIANRGEIAIRIAAAAAELGICTLSVYADDDSASLHRYKADESVLLRGSGPAAYLDGAQFAKIAKEHGCDSVHPGYGFLSESSDFASQCELAGLCFIGPSARVLELFAHKAKARDLARQHGVPIIPGSQGEVSLADAIAFFKTLGDGARMMIKAVAGGGGRGIRIVSKAEEISDAYLLCQAEAKQAFGEAGLFVEEFMARARHIEIQVIADQKGGVIHVGERECSIQRRNQKMIEIAPCPDLSQSLRQKIANAAITLARASRYAGLGTFEFLVDADELLSNPDGAKFAFIEANPRVQVEHTVTEEVMNVDLVKAQIQVASGATLDELGLVQTRFNKADGFALQARINLEVMTQEGSTRPSTGTIETYEMPSGRGVRVDGYGYSGYSVNPRYDSLLAKVIVHSVNADFNALLLKAQRALGDCRIVGVETNIPFLQVLLQRNELTTGRMHTRFVDENMQDLLAADAELRTLRHAHVADVCPADVNSGLGIDALGGLVPAGSLFVEAPMTGMVIEINVAPNSMVSKGHILAVIEAMKMVHTITAPTAGIVRLVGVAVGEVVSTHQRLFVLDASDGDLGESIAESIEVDLDQIRPDLAEIIARRHLGQDASRPDAVAKRRGLNRRTARENIGDLCDEGSFVEYGALAIAAQRRRRSLDDLARNTPADGIVAGVGQVNGELFGTEPSKCVVLSYDYMVLAGTQGHQTHRKKDRMFELAEKERLPVILMTEGGGGRPGDVDVVAVAGLEIPSFYYLAKLSGLVPLIGINSGFCFAGNAALLGCCDVIIATEDSSIGMGGPAVIEGGGLGVYRPEEVGPMSVQVPNGVVDIAVKDEAEAIATAKKYISYFQGPLKNWAAPDQRMLRTLIPDDRRRTYKVRAIIEALCDVDSVLEIRKAYGRSIVTALARIEGRPIGIVASDSMHLGGAIDGPSADKAARFMQLCDAHDVPLLSLCDTPGFMVGPESEKTAAVRRFARMFVTGASMTTQLMVIVLRKAYGLGAMSMFSGHSKLPSFTVSWPSGEFGGMGLEGAVKLGLRKELAAIKDPVEREEYFQKQLAAVYKFGKAENAASYFEIDDVIDPAESRRWIVSALASRSMPVRRREKKRNHIDTW